MQNNTNCSHNYITYGYKIKTFLLLYENPFKDWLYTKDYWYYLDSNGHMKTGWIKSNGKWYYLNEYGVMLQTTTFNGYTLDSNGAWIY